jgi:hypothetical protein
MQVSVEKPGTPEELVHVGVLGMKWGHRKSSGSSTSTTKTPMSKKKKVAIGVGVGVAVVAGAAIAGHMLGSRGKLRISDIDGGKDNIIRLKNGKGAISTLSHEQWNTKISNAKASFKMRSAASKSIAARRKAGMPGYRPGEMLGVKVSKEQQRILDAFSPSKRPEHVNNLLGMSRRVNQGK